MEDFKQQNVEHLIGLSVGLDTQVPPGTGSLCVLGWWGGWKRAYDIIIGDMGEEKTTPINFLIVFPYTLLF